MSGNLESLQADVAAINQISIVPSLLNVLCQTTGMRFAAIARVTEEKWITCTTKDEINFGLKPGDELKLQTTICNEIRQSRHPVVIDNVEKDPHYAAHHTPALYGFQSYISVPIIRKDGSFFGTLCAIDPKPARLDTPEVRSMFYLFADLISFHLNVIEELRVSEANLLEERKIAKLREQFIAILGHDLRNPVATTKVSAETLLELPLGEDARQLAQIIKSTNFRMDGLIENILDFARGRLGGGITLNLQFHQEILEIELKQLISETSAVTPNRTIKTDIQLDKPVRCDVNRVAQLFSNLLGNAITHGAKRTPILVIAKSDDNGFLLSVTNQGEKISDRAMEYLFQPFSREEVKPGKHGLGLGLYIASEIARVHGGSLSVDSTDERTQFTFKLPAVAKK